MASEQASLPVNGNYGVHQHAAPSPSPGPSEQQGAPAPEISKDEVAWYFVERYYNTLSRTPDKLFLFYNKRSQFVAGEEAEKVHVYSGQRSINERIKELDFQSCKVRVTNVDSQTSDNKIFIQVIGEMSNKNLPHRKFVQSFVLAAQTNGYFVLNDIFRFINDDEEETEQEEPQHEAAVDAGGLEEPVSAAEEVSGMRGGAEPHGSVTHEENVKEVDEKLEQVIKDDANKEDAPLTNGTTAVESAEATENTPAQAAVVPEEKLTEPEPVAPEDPQADLPKEPAPTPVAPKSEAKSTPKVATTPVAPPKPSGPKTWAQLAGANRATPAPAVPTPPSSSNPTPAQAKPISTTQTPAQSSATPLTDTEPPRQPSPADSGREGSSGGWQTAGAEHSRKQSRAQVGPTVGENGKVRAYVKNVYAGVDADELKSVLSRFGELAYFDINRAKNSAFVEFQTVAGFNAAVAANPHKIGTDAIYVEERRVTGTPQRGSARGRGGASFDNRTNQGRGGFAASKGEGASRGGGYPARGGRGGTGGVANRPRPQAV